MSNIYENGTYLRNNPTWHEEDSSWKARQILKIIKKNALEKVNNICEVGCGVGEIIKIISLTLGSTKNYFGYEIAESAFNICKKKEQINLKYFCTDILLEKDNYYDIILCIDVFEHIENYLDFLNKLKYKGEYKLFHIPLDLSVQRILKPSQLIKLKYSVGHLHFFNKEIALDALKNKGYEIIDFFYTRGSIELPNKTIKDKLLKIPRKLLFSLNEDFTVRTLGGFSLLVLTK